MEQDNAHHDPPDKQGRGGPTAMTAGCRSTRTFHAPAQRNSSVPGPAETCRAPTDRCSPGGGSPDRQRRAVPGGAGRGLHARAPPPPVEPGIHQHPAAPGDPARPRLGRKLTEEAHPARRYLAVMLIVGFALDDPGRPTGRGASGLSPVRASGPPARRARLPGAGADHAGPAVRRSPATGAAWLAAGQGDLIHRRHLTCGRYQGLDCPAERFRCARRLTGLTARIYASRALWPGFPARLDDGAGWS